MGGLYLKTTLSIKRGHLFATMGRWGKNIANFIRRNRWMAPIKRRLNYYFCTKNTKNVLPFIFIKYYDNASYFFFMVFL